MTVRACSSLPTLTACSTGRTAGGARGRVGSKRHSVQSLARQGALPTLAARDWRSGKGGPATWPNGEPANARPLAEWAEMVGLPALTVKGNYNRKGSSATSGDGLATALWRLTGCRGPLNPRWCALYMGFPMTWLDGPLAADRPGSRRSETP